MVGSRETVQLPVQGKEMGRRPVRARPAPELKFGRLEPEQRRIRCLASPHP